jgi:hypothetical protein
MAAMRDTDLNPHAILATLGVHAAMPLDWVAGGPGGLQPPEADTLHAFEASWCGDYRRWHTQQPLFMAWAVALLQRYLEPRLRQPDISLSERDFARFQRWTNAWKRRAGLDG